jgi:hypothetical protein
MREYLLLLHETPSDTAPLSPTEMQALRERDLVRFAPD